MVTVEVTPNRCAADLMDTLWSIMRFIRNKVKDQTGSTSSMATVGAKEHLASCISILGRRFLSWLSTWSEQRDGVRDNSSGRLVVYSARLSNAPNIRTRGASLN